MTIYVKQTQTFEAVKWKGDNWHEVDAFVNRQGIIWAYRVEDFPYPMNPEWKPSKHSICPIGEAWIDNYVNEKLDELNEQEMHRGH